VVNPAIHLSFGDVYCSHKNADGMGMVYGIGFTTLPTIYGHINGPNSPNSMPFGLRPRCFYAASRISVSPLELQLRARLHDVRLGGWSAGDVEPMSSDQENWFLFGGLRPSQFPLKCCCLRTI